MAVKRKSRAEKKLPPKADNRPLYWARRPFRYGGVELDRGCVVRLAGKVNDEALVRLGYLAEVKKGQGTSECGTCVREFVDQTMRDAHVRRTHREESPARRIKNIDDLSPTERNRLLSETLDYRTEGPPPLVGDNQPDREEQMLQEVAPLYVENSRANRGP
jgi:hypothetical protein